VWARFEPPDSVASMGSVSALAGLREFGRSRRTLITVLGSLATAAVLAFVLAGRRHEFATALSDVAAWLLALTVLLQIVALLARSEAWHLSIQAAGGTVDRRVLYRASSMGVLGSVLNAQLGVAARIAALRRSSPAVSPQVPTLIAAEFPILAVEATLAALTSFTLVGPLGLPWWLPLICLAVIGTASAGLRHLALGKGRELWKGPRGTPQPAGWNRCRRLRPGGRVRADLPQLAAAARGRRERVVLRCDRRADRFGDPRSASGRPQCRRRGRRAHPGQRWSGGSSSGRRVDDGDGHDRWTVLRGLGWRRPALVA
jgi:hypothetical protein